MRSVPAIVLITVLIPGSASVTVADEEWRPVRDLSTEEIQVLPVQGDVYMLVGDARADSDG